MYLENQLQNLKEGQELILRALKLGKTEKTELKVYTLDEVAKTFSVTKRTIYNWKDRGILPCTIIGSKTYLTEVLKLLHLFGQ